MRVMQVLNTWWVGWWSLWIRDFGAAHAETVIQGSIEKRKGDRRELIVRAKVLRAQLWKVEAKLKELRIDLAKTEGGIRNAITTNDRESGAVLLQQKRALEEEIAGFVRQQEELAAADRDVKDDIAKFGRDIIATQHKLNVKSARAASARITQAILDEVSSLSVRGDNQAVEAAFESMDAEIAGAEIARETDGSVLERRIERLMDAGAKDANMADFDRMRAEHEQSQGTHAAGGSSGSDGAGGKIA